MANHPSALRAHRQSERRKNRNRRKRAALRTALKRFSEDLSKAGAGEAKESLSRIYSLLDKAIQEKALSKNAAARKKSRLTRRLNASAAQPS